MTLKHYILSAEDGRKFENSKLNKHANGSLSPNAANSMSQLETDMEPDPDGTQQAFLSLETIEKGQAKASVIQVFKKVNLLMMCIITT